MAIVKLKHNHNIITVRAGGGRRLVQQACEDDVSAVSSSSLLLVVGFVTCLTLTVVVLAGAADSSPAESLLAHRVYLGAFLGAFGGGLATMWAAIWVAVVVVDAARRRATGRIILGASLVPMVVAFGLTATAATTPTARFDILAGALA